MNASFAATYPCVRARRRVLGALLAVLVPAAAAGPQASEYQVKAAYLCKFANYVEWPPAPAGSPQPPFVIGLLASQAIVDEMAQVARGLAVDGRAVVVRRLRAGDGFEGVSIVFIARSDAARVHEALAALQGRPVLTVTEAEPGSDVGSIVNFVVIDDKVRFDIALPPAQRGGLKISARLLAVARVVTGSSL